MRSTKADRRSQRTRQLLNAALIGLMAEKPYDQITVQDIIDRANVGRSTFYAHYVDKEDLLVSDFTRVLDALLHHMEQNVQGERPTAISLALFFEHVQAHHHLYKALVRGGGIDILLKKGHTHMRRKIEQQLQGHIPAGHTPAAPLPLVADYVAGAILTMITWWLDNDMPNTPEQMDAMFQRLVLRGVHETLQAA